MPAQTSAATSPRRYAKGVARREAIVDTAASRFAQDGFAATTILDIAAETGISRAGLLHYFPDKEALLRAVLEHRDQLDRARFSDAWAREPGGVGILRGIVELSRHNEQAPELIALFVRLSAEAADPAHPAHAYFLERNERIRQGTAQALRAAARHGYLLRPAEAAEDASLLTALMDGLQVQWLVDRRVPMSALVRSAIRALLSPAGLEAFDQRAPKSGSTTT